MLYQVESKGLAPIIMHSGAGIDPEHPANREIARITSKKASARVATEHARIRTLEVIKALWIADGQPIIPASAIRAAIETAARKTKEGPLVREGLLITNTAFTWDTERYGDGSDLDKLATAVEYTVPVVIQRSRLLRTRAKFDPPWGVSFTVDADEELIDKTRLAGWVELAGRRIGLGDWRPEKSGECGRFETVSIKEI